MDIGKALTFVFEDPEWTSKVLIGGLMVLGGVLLSPILIGFFFFFVLQGYAVELFKNVRDGVEYPLPRWDNWGDKAVTGLKLFVIFLIWSLPIIVIAVISAILSALLGNTDLEGLAAILSICLSCISTIWSILLALAIPGILNLFAETEEISSGLRFGEIIAFTRDHIGNIIIALIGSVVAGLVGALAGTLLCGIGLLFAGFWAAMVEFHLFGQIARQAQAPAEIPSATV